MGALPELESPVELAGLSLLMANGFTGGAEEIGARELFLFKLELELDVMGTIVELLCRAFCPELLPAARAPTPLVPLDATVLNALALSAFAVLNLGLLAPTLLGFEEATLDPPFDDTFSFEKDEVDAPKVEDDDEEATVLVVVAEEGDSVLLLCRVAVAEFDVLGVEEASELSVEFDLKFDVSVGSSATVELLALNLVFTAVLALAVVNVDLTSSSTGF
jgi:hypothetical protein